MSEPYKYHLQYNEPINSKGEQARASVQMRLYDGAFITFICICLHLVTILVFIQAPPTLTGHLFLKERYMVFLIPQSVGI